MNCVKCLSILKQGIAIENTVTGIPDFIGDKDNCTISAGGSGKLIPCLKCPNCGYSVYNKKKGTNDTNREDTQVI